LDVTTLVFSVMAAVFPSVSAALCSISLNVAALASRLSMVPVIYKDTESEAHGKDVNSISANHQKALAMIIDFFFKTNDSS
jgi:hypothetical protein